MAGPADPRCARLRGTPPRAQPVRRRRGPAWQRRNQRYPVAAGAAWDCHRRPDDRARDRSRGSATSRSDAYTRKSRDIAPALRREPVSGRRARPGGHRRACRVEDLPVPQRYRPVLAARLGDLSSAARRTVLAAALLSRPTAPILARIGGPQALAEAQAAGVVRHAGELIEFDHPLLAAAGPEEADPATIRSMHAELTSLVGDAIQRGRHLALSAAGPDERAAAAVEDAAKDAADRAAIATAAELARHALALTPD